MRMNDNIEVIPDGKFAPEDWEYMLLQMVNDHSGIDFGMYRMATFRRRYLKCMNANDAQDIRDYVKILEEDDEKLDLLVSDLLIGVTSFFRDSAAFRILKEKAIVELFNEDNDEPVRVWVAGCSTGMEAYSIAMLMDSVSVEHGKSFTIFATDISRPSLAQASKGVYTQKQYSSVPAEYRGYFTEKDGAWKIKRTIRSHMVFSYHDVLSDPPFARMDIVSCRNMMIYLKPKAQNIVLERLNYSLSKGGYLFLGSGETPGKNNSNLKTIDSRWRIFQKISDTALTADIFPLDKFYTKAGSARARVPYSEQVEDDVFHRSRSFTSCLEERFFPDCVFIDEDYSTLFISGDLNSYLTIPSGIPGGSLLPMLPSRLRAAVRAGVRRASGGFSRIRCETGEAVTIFVSCISPIDMSSVYLVEFHREDPGRTLDQSIACSESDSSILEEQIALLESELASARRELRSRTGELQASNEELQTTNEEIRSANEELTASNEELIASNEELHRLNIRLSVLSDDIMNLIESMDVGSLFLDEQLNIRRFNPTICRFFNITDSDVGRSITDFTTTLSPKSIETLMSASREVVASEVILDVSLEASLPGYWIAKIAPYKTASGTTKGTVITFVDITLIRESELSLAGSERKFRGLFNGFPIGAILVSHTPENSQFEIVNRNPEFRALEAIHENIVSNEDFVHGIVAEEPVFTFVHGDFTFQSEVFRPADYADTLCVTVRDITTENRTNLEKEILQKRLTDSQLLAGMGIWEYDAIEKTVNLSPEAAELFELSSNAPVTVNSLSGLIANFEELYASVKEELSKGRTFSGMISIYSGPTRSLKYYKLRAYSSPENSSRNTVYGYALDVTSEVESERVLKDAHDKLYETQEIARIGLIEVEWQENYTSYRSRMNDSAIRVLKYDSQKDRQRDFLKKCLDPQLTESVLNQLRTAAKNKTTTTIDVPAKNGKGKSVFLQLIAKPSIRYDGSSFTSLVIIDITRRHQLENELKHSDKLRSVGELAGGIAHDFNNQLMGIVGFAECLRNLQCNPEQVEYIRGILTSAERAGALVRQLLAFSRKGLSNVAPFDLHHQIDDVISLLQRSIDRRIEIRRTLQASNSTVIGDASEMNNAMLNLAINARDAMKGNGILTFKTSNPSPDTVVIVISDTGTGMTEEVMEHVFEPFFTTKPLGDGTGMGLPAVYGTIAAHSGSITIESEIGQGTSVKVILPVSESDTVESEVFRAPKSEGPMEGTILLVDDEKIVRTVLKMLMETLGFTVITASDGVEAVQLFRENQGEVVLVLMDMTMPRKNGIEAFSEMKELQPDVKVIILSGHSAESSSNEMMNLGICRVLQKPVTVSVLSIAIKDVLGI